MPSSVFVATAFVVLGRLVAAADECQPSTWDRRAILEVGEVNCRYDITTGPDLGLYSCESIAAKYEATVDKLLDLNPGLDCEDLQPNTTYCVDGFFEPLRAYDGRCGPNFGGATCVGTPGQCCNSKTWTCGKTEEDCEAGTCFEDASFCHAPQ